MLKEKRLGLKGVCFPADISPLVLVPIIQGIMNREEKEMKSFHLQLSNVSQ